MLSVAKHLLYLLENKQKQKHLPFVKRFYRQIRESNRQSDRAAKVKERLEKNRDKLFTFLSYDEVPWNNNVEHAVKPFAELRQIIGGVTTEKGLRDYWVLLEPPSNLQVHWGGLSGFPAFGRERHPRLRRQPAQTKTTVWL